jgi:CRISPR-associated protein Cas5d
MKSYPVQLEISGPTAMWTRPDTGDAPVSYPAPTFQAAKQIFESILWLRSAEVIPTKVEICRPLLFHRYFTNYGGPLREGGGKGDDSHQLIATVLINVHYRLFAKVVPHDPRPETLSSKARFWKEAGMNGAHAYKEMFELRLRRGQLYHIPFLGWKEFTPTFVKPVAEESEPTPRPEESVDGISIPSMLFRTFERGQFTRYNPEFKTKDVIIKKGVMEYAE